MATNRRMRSFMILATCAAFIATAVLAIVGCAKPTEKPVGKPEPGATPATDTGQPRPSEPTTMEVVVYYVKMDEKNTWMVKEAHEVTKTPAVARAALEELISGEPKTEGAFRVLPKGTRVLDVTIDRDGLCTVDFSREVLNANVGAEGEAFGIKTIVNTLTEFPTIKKVQFTVEGKIDERTRDWWGHVGLYDQPFTRDLTWVLEPAIWVTEPKPGAKVTSPVTVRGDACVFEATVNIRVVTEGGTKLAETFTNASEGAPGRGPFSASVRFTPPASGTRGFVEVFWASPKDGSEQDLVRIPVVF